MPETTLASARKQNDSLEKSLQSLRGKLIGLRGDGSSHKVGSYPLRTTGRGNVGANEHVDRVDRRGEKVDTQFANPTTRRYKDPSDFISKIPKPILRRDDGERKSVPKSDSVPRQPNEHVTFDALIRNEGNYFDDFRSKVNEIRKLREAGAGSNHTRPNSNNSGFNTKEQDPKKHNSSKHSEARNFLVTKIESQNEFIDELEAKVHELKLQNEALYEAQDTMKSKLRVAEAEHVRQEKLHRQDLLNMEARSNFQYERHDEEMARLVSSDRDIVLREQSERMKLEAQLEETNRENTHLRRRVSEIAERAHLLNSIHEQRVKTLESKLKASMDVAKYYCDIVGSQMTDIAEDSTEDILFGPHDNTTIDLLKDTPEFYEGAATKGKKSLRSYFLAVLFTIRLKKEMEAQRLWEPYLRS
ncbi:hypothetical protein JCM33374_g688 [Metschnikowia sp. JCM 33374]|nr:hypothetical protein JCM33374_g688 [Metschnikowia sp. JCM 33374]